MTAEETIKAEAVAEQLVLSIAADLEGSIAALGYPVGLGIAPHPDACAKAARRIVSRISDGALGILIARQVAPIQEGDGR